MAQENCLYVKFNLNPCTLTSQSPPAGVNAQPSPSSGEGRAALTHWRQHLRGQQPPSPLLRASGEVPSRCRGDYAAVWL